MAPRHSPLSVVALAAAVVLLLVLLHAGTSPLDVGEAEDTVAASPVSSP